MPIQITEAQQHIRNLLEQKGVGVLATADSAGEPHAATIYFTFDEDFNIYFVTKAKTQKCQNLQANARAALAVFDEVSQSTAQISGVVSEVQDMTTANKVFTDVLRITLASSDTSVPPVTKLEAGQYVVFKMTPGSARLAAYIRPDASSYDQIFEFA